MNYTLTLIITDGKLCAAVQSEIEAIAIATVGHSGDIFVLPVSLGGGAYLEYDYNLLAWRFTNEY